MVETAPGRCKNAANAYPPYPLEVLLRRNPRGLHRDGVSHVCPTPNIPESTEGEYLV